MKAGTRPLKSTVLDYNLLDLGGLTSLVTNVKVSLWGNEVLIEYEVCSEDFSPQKKIGLKSSLQTFSNQVRRFWYHSRQQYCSNLKVPRG